jgi:hypothetical protein
MLTLTAAFSDVAPYPGGADAPLYLLLGAGVCGGSVLLVLVVVVALFLFRRREKAPEPGPGLLEDLAEYPPPPPRSGKRQLTVRHRPARLRLVVIAPMGRRDLRAYGDAEDLLDRVVRGLGDVAREDRPRVRTWPPQLSGTGFPPTFFRNTRRPADRAQGQHWWLLAGPARAGDVPVLLGLALWSEEAGEPAQRTVEPHQWEDLLRVEP